MKNGGQNLDPYDALNSRRYVLSELERHIELFKRHHRPFALLMVTFDNLSQVNETFGTEGGDALLQHALALIKRDLRDIDIVSWYEEYELAVIMPETTKKSALAGGARITRAVNATSLMLDEKPASLAISFSASSCPEDGTTAKALLDVSTSKA